MNLTNVSSVMQMAYQKINQTKETTAGNISFAESLQGTVNSGTEKVDAYKGYLEQKYGTTIIQSVGKDQKSIDNIGSGTAGTGNVVIAPNILEQMANDPEKAAYYEEKIQYYFDSVPRYAAELSAMGHKINSSGIIIHPDGTVTHYISGEESPEKKAKFEAAQKEKREKKIAEQKENRERSQEIAEERARLEQIQYHKQLMEQMQNSQVFDSAADFYIVGQTQPVSPAVSAYEKAISTMSSSIIQGI